MLQKKAFSPILEFGFDVLSYLGCKLWIIQTKPTAVGGKCHEYLLICQEIGILITSKRYLEHIIGTNSSRPVVVVLNRAYRKKFKCGD